MNLKKYLRPIGPQWLRWLLFLAAGFCMGLVIATAVQMVDLKTLPAVWDWARERTGFFFITVLLYGTAVCVLGALTGRLWLGAIPVGLLGLILALVDFFKNAINGTPLELADFGLAAQAGNVAGLAGDLTPPDDFWQAAELVLACVLLLLLTQPLTALRGRVRAWTLMLSLTAVVVLWTSSGAWMLGSRFGVDFYTRIDAAENHSRHGLTLSIWRDLFPQVNAPPEGYGADYMQGVLARIDALLQEGGEADRVPAQEPNVLFILSESFFDITRLPDLIYSGDPLENFHALEAESVSGTFHSHYLGYGTGYIEMSMLYGLGALDVPPGTNLCFMNDAIYEKFDALAEQFTATGDYKAEMLHGFDNSLYNRTVTYPLMGFSDLYFSPDIQELGIDWQGGSIYGGYYMRDSYFFKGMLERMKTINAGGKRAFLFGITMENHQPFNPDKFNYDSQLKLTAEQFRPDERDIIRVMMEGVTRADQALGQLTDALRESEEPTIVVFFGDHRPNIFLPEGDTIYTKLGLCPENDSTNWTIDQFGDLYSTDYLIWANDAALLQGRAGTRQDSSVTGLGPLLLELTGWQSSRYWGLLEEVSRVCLTNQSFYFVDGQGSASVSREEAGLSAQAEELLDLREAVMYDAVYGKQYITKAMNQPPAKTG